MTVHVKATVVTVADGRVRLDLICPTRRDADALIERLYPDALFSSAIVTRRIGAGARPC